MLLEILQRPEVDSAIVFTRTKSRADRVAKLLVREIQGGADSWRSLAGSAQRGVGGIPQRHFA